MTTNGSPRVIHVIPHDGIGGVEVAARSLAGRSDCSCDFRLLLIGGGSLAAEPGRIIESPYRSPLNPLAQLRAVRLLLKSAAEVMIFSLWRSVPVALLVRLLRPSQRLVYFLNLDRPVHRVDAFFARLAIAFADEVWADSEATLTARLKGRKKASRVISFVTERLPAPKATPPLRPRFVAWSRLNRQKGIDRALHFVAALVAAGVDARFDIWGPDDGELGALQALSASLGLTERVRFRGPAPREALAQLAGEACFFLQLSRAEGMAMGTVEAMQLGLVPIVTAVGEMPRYVEDGASGIIVDPERPEPGIERLMALLGDEARYRAMREKARAYWEHAPLYADDVCRAAAAVAADPHPQQAASHAGS